MSKKGPKDSVVYNQQLPYTIDQMTRRTDEQFGSCHLQEEVPSGGKLLSAINRAYSPYRSMKFVGAFVNDESRRRVTTPSGRMHLPLTFVAANTYSLDHHRNTSESVPHILRHLIISSPLYHSTNSKGDTEVLPTIPIGASVLPACAALTGNSLGYDFQQNSTERKVGLSFFTEQTNRLPPNLPSSNMDLSIQRTFEKHPLPPSHNVVAKGVNLGAMKPSHKQFSHCKLLLQSNSHNKFYDSVTETSDRFLGPNNILSSNHNNIKTRLVITPSPKKPSIKETNDWLDKCSKWYAFTSSEKGEEVPPSCVKFPYRIWNDAPLCMQPTLIAGYKVFGESANKLQKIEDLPVYLASLVAGIMVFRAAVNSSPTDPLGRALLDTCTKCNMSVISPFDEVLRSFFNLFGHHLLPSIDGKGHLMSAHIESTHFLLHIRSVKYKKSFFFEVPIYHPQSGELLSPAVILNQLISVVKGNSGVAAVMSMEIDLGDYRAGDINYIAGAALNEVTACTMLTRLQCNSNSEKIINSSLFNVLINLFDEDDDISKNYTLPSDSSLTNGGLGVCVNVTLSDFLLAFDAYACLDPIKCASRPSVNVNTFFHALEATLPNESDASMLSATSFVLNAANIIESLLIDMLHGGAMKEGTKGIFCPGEDVVGDGESPNGHLPLPSVSGTSELRLSVSSLFCDKKDVSENVTKEKVIDCRVSIPTQIIQRAMQQKEITRSASRLENARNFAAISSPLSIFFVEDCLPLTRPPSSKPIVSLKKSANSNVVEAKSNQAQSSFGKGVEHQHFFQNGNFTVMLHEKISIPAGAIEGDDILHLPMGLDVGEFQSDVVKNVGKSHSSTNKPRETPLKGSRELDSHESITKIQVHPKDLVISTEEDILSERATKVWNTMKHEREEAQTTGVLCKSINFWLPMNELNTLKMKIIGSPRESVFSVAPLDATITDPLMLHLSSCIAMSGVLLECTPDIIRPPIIHDIYFPSCLSSTKRPQVIPLLTNEISDLLRCVREFIKRSRSPKLVPELRIAFELALISLQPHPSHTASKIKRVVGIPSFVSSFETIQGSSCVPEDHPCSSFPALSLCRMVGMDDLYSPINVVSTSPAGRRARCHFSYSLNSLSSGDIAMCGLVTSMTESDNWVRGIAGRITAALEFINSILNG